MELVILDCSIAENQMYLFVGYFDADWVGNVNDRKCTIGGCFYVGANLVAWMSKKLNILLQ